MVYCKHHSECGDYTEMYVCFVHFKRPMTAGCQTGLDVLVFRIVVLGLLITWFDEQCTCLHVF